ncbi:hypothetical protein PR002_g19715 [Phytophthora rubi]|uniref:Uncharacterized protein n=1 Tax=Phytophthora rubi TaxID=129364 RepID=A0A6A3JKK3_9STRA|nr:hypothetical protein PR002_g19715 [Phytophthora rubi]
MNLSLFDACLRQYQAVLANDEVNQLRGVQYVYALWGALFAVPVSVLTESEDRYGEYGRALKKWWDAAYATFYAYLPDLALSTAHSTAKYARASKEASVSSGKRTAEVFRVGFQVALLCVSLLIHLPLAAYNLLELLLLGKVGVALAPLLFNCANYYLEWTRWGLPASVIVVAVGLTSCIWRMGEADGPLKELTPPTYSTISYHSRTRWKSYLLMPYLSRPSATPWLSRPNFVLPRRGVLRFVRNSSSIVSAEDGVPSVAENVPHLNLRVPF